jgi:CxxC-x17-CxxC domain-containing protein
MVGYGNFRGSGAPRSGGFRRGGFGGPRRSFGPREMTKIKCAECGKEDEVPFKPRDNSTVLCKECFFKKKGIEPTAKPESSAKPEGEGAAEPAGEEAISEEEI